MATDGWPTAKLGDVVANHDSRRIPLSSRERATRQGRYPYYGAAGVIDFVDRPIFSGLHLLVGEDGSVVREDGRPFLQLADGEFWVNNHAHVLTGDTDVETRFIYYALSNTNIRGWVTGAVQPKLNQGNMNQIEIPFPDEGVRRAIVSVLGALDDKIEVNRKQARVLEGIARAVFNSWFVDLDPVRYNIRQREHAALGRAGRFISTGDDITISDSSGKVIHRAGDAVYGRIAHLFPDRLVDSPLGEVPEGWRVGTLGDFFEIGLGGAWGEEAADSRADTAVRCLRGIDCHALAEGELPDIPIRWVSAKQAADRALADGSILVEGSGSFCGRSLCWDSAYFSLVAGPVGYSNFCKRIDPKTGTAAIDSAQAIVCWLQMRRAYSTGELQAFRTGTAFPNFDIHGALANLPIVVPTAPEAGRFADFFRQGRRLDLLAQNRTLAALRDALLPKLISGELRIADAEKIVVRAV